MEIISFDILFVLLEILIFWYFYSTTLFSSNVVERCLAAFIDSLFVNVFLFVTGLGIYFIYKVAYGIIVLGY